VQLCNFSKAQSLARKSSKNNRGSYNMELCTPSVYHGTPPYAAPEIAEQIPCNLSIDTYSFAIVLWEIMSLRLCFGRESKTMHSFAVIMEGEQQYNGSRRPEIDKDTPQALRDIMKHCWAAEPRDRPCMKEVHAKLKDFQETLAILL
jgi:serine/threonine protein kinase